MRTLRRLTKQRREWWAVALAAVLLIGTTLSLLLWIWPEAVDPTWERILKTGTLRVCTDPSWPPFESVNEGTSQIVGFDADLADRLAERLASEVRAEPAVRAQFVAVGFDSLYDALLVGRCDVILSALPYEQARTRDVVYSVAYFNAGLVLLTQQGSSTIEILEDLEGRTVGVEWGFVPEGDTRQKEFLRRLAARRYDTADDALRALQAGEVDAAIVDRITALAYLRECGDLTLVGEPIYDVNYVIPVRPDSFRLLAEINRVLLEMREDGTLQALQERWF